MALHLLAMYLINLNTKNETQILKQVELYVIAITYVICLLLGFALSISSAPMIISRILPVGIFVIST